MYSSSRRDFLKASGFTVAAGLLGGCAGMPLAPSRKTKDSIRVAHLTDFHVQPELQAPRGMASCLHHVQSLKRKPDFIFNTGDCVMNALGTDRNRADVQWNVWNSVLKSDCSLPIHSCIGNHDIWGWAKDSSHTTGNEPGWGKKLVMDQLGLATPYHAFEHGAWKFIMLDSCQAAKEGVWEARLDDAQWAWLEAELAATQKPVMIGSHVPILAPAVFLDEGRISGTPEAPALAVRRSHLDVKKFGALFKKYRNVKLCVSGHLHEIDRADYLGVTYATNPAVCGNWWQGLHRGVFGEMYTVIDLHPDGTFDIERVDYGWVPVVNSTTQPSMA